MTQQPYQPTQAPPQGWGPPPGYGPPVQHNPDWNSPPAQAPTGPSPFTQPGQAGPPPSAGDPFGNPGAPTGGGGDQPGMHQLGGRLLLIRPTSFDPSAPPHPSSQNGRPGPLVMAELIVCDGEPIPGNVNGDTEQFTPFAAGPKVVPFYCGSMFIRGAVLPGQLEAYVAGRGYCLGRMVKGTPGKAGKPPWVLADPTEQDKVIGRQIHAQWDQIKAAGAPVRPDQFGAPVGQQAPPQGYGQATQYQSPLLGYGPPPNYPAQNPYGAPPQAPPGWNGQPTH